MDVRTSTLVACLAVVSASVVIAVAAGFFTFYDEPQPANPMPRVSSGATIRPASASQRDWRKKYSDTQNQLIRAEQLLASANARLKQTERDLRTSQSQGAVLKTELTRAAEFSDMLLNAVTTLASDADVLPAADPDDPDAATPADPTEDEPTDLERLRDLLAERDEELQDAEDAAESEVLTLIEESLAFRSELARVIVGLGIPAVDPVVELLNHPEANLRIWAAQTLGQMGPDAADAVTAIRRLSRDENEKVRAAAQKALKAILE
ncbi:MAG: HEAT repeat domain-containing protein [Pirellulaceae bacterium]|jgi:hypothetical protein|nr:HEAT repeat domain-containing protein [Pirellulaceae bacterium]MDP7017213.1 HEAT repeat domain-containing protein [Pirellulaceae bacterium]